MIKLQKLDSFIRSIIPTVLNSIELCVKPMILRFKTRLEMWDDDSPLIMTSLRNSTFLKAASKTLRWMALVNMAPAPTVSDANRAKEPSCDSVDSVVDSTVVVQTENPVVMVIPTMVVMCRMTLASAELAAVIQLL